MQEASSDEGINQIAMWSELKRSKIYLRLKSSPIYDAYWRVLDRRFVDQRDREVAFYRDTLEGFRTGDLVFDVGANSGDKAAVFLRMGARIVAVEPDPQSRKVLQGKFLSYRLKPKPVIIVGKAVSEKIGIETMMIDAPGSALNTLNKKWAETLRQDKHRADASASVLEFQQESSVETTTLDQLIDAYGVPFFIKIDVEGYEISALRGLRQPIRYLSFEVNLPEFRQEGLECIELLANLASGGQFNYTADCARGLALSQWLDAGQFAHTLEGCNEKCIEVFWRTGQATALHNSQIA